MSWTTADLYDAHEQAVAVVDAPLRAFGGRARFAGPVRTVRAFADNSEVKRLLATPGHGAVLVVDGAGSTAWSLLGDNLAAAAVANGWSGVVVHGAVRDVVVLRELPLGVLALGSTPRKTAKQGQGLAGVDVALGGVVVREGDWLYADEDGVLIATTPLH